MSVRCGRKEDIGSCAKINIDSWRTAYKELIPEKVLASLDIEQVTRNFEKSFADYSFCVYEDNDFKVQGYSFYGKQQYEIEGFSDYDCELISIYVHSEEVKNGIGKKIFQFVTDDFKKQGKQKMLLWCFEENKPATAFYEKMGGKVISSKELLIGGRICMEVALGFEL